MTMCDDLNGCYGSQTKLWTVLYMATKWATVIQMLCAEQEKLLPDAILSRNKRKRRHAHILLCVNEGRCTKAFGRHGQIAWLIEKVRFCLEKEKLLMHTVNGIGTLMWIHRMHWQSNPSDRNYFGRTMSMVLTMCYERVPVSHLDRFQMPVLHQFKEIKKC